MTNEISLASLLHIAKSLSRLGAGGATVIKTDRRRIISQLQPVANHPRSLKFTFDPGAPVYGGKPYCASLRRILIVALACEYINYSCAVCLSDYSKKILNWRKFQMLYLGYRVYLWDTCL
jgi:hypothetical protein